MSGGQHWLLVKTSSGGASQSTSTHPFHVAWFSKHGRLRVVGMPYMAGLGLTTSVPVVKMKLYHFLWSSFGSHIVSLWPRSVVWSIHKSRFEGKGPRPHFLMGNGKSHCRRANGVGNTVLAILGKYRENLWNIFLERGYSALEGNQWNPKWFREHELKSLNFLVTR